MPLPRKPLSLKAKALQALALREHSRSELRQKLLRHPPQTGARPKALGAGSGADRVDTSVDACQSPEVEHGAAAERLTARAAEVDALLDELQAQGLLSIERFIESRVHARASRFGNRRIQAELAQHGLRLDTDTAQELRRTEFERAQAVWARRFGAPGDTPPAAADVARQMRFLAARGFSPEVIRRVVKGGSSEE